jgi:hypothetical protein
MSPTKEYEIHFSTVAVNRFVSCYSIKIAASTETEATEIFWKYKLLKFEGLHFYMLDDVRILRVQDLEVLEAIKMLEKNR